MQNTPEALQYAIKEWNEDISGANLHFIAMLAFNQKKYYLVLRLLGNNEFLTAVNVKLLAMTELNDWKGVCNLLYKIKTNRSIEKSYRISTEVVSDQQKSNQTL